MKRFPLSVKSEVLKAYALYHGDENSQIGLYGGTFTAIENWKEILKEVYSTSIDIGIKSIRISTRPDEIYDVDFLKENGVTLVEIGAQSMVQRVLDMSERFHTVEDVVRSVEKIKKSGMKVSVHLMSGLPSDTKRDDIFSAFEVAKLKPDGVRIHPTLVLKNTKLEKLYLSGNYVPQKLEEAVEVVCDMMAIFKSDKIQIERMGMYQDKETIGNLVAGPYHPSFGELVISELYKKFLLSVDAAKVYGPENLRSQIVGRNKIRNIIFESAAEISAVSGEGTFKFDNWLSKYVSHLKELVE